MTNNQEIDKNFSGRLNILRAGVLGANDGIISIAGVVIGVASATESVWIIFLSQKIQRLLDSHFMQLISRMASVRHLPNS